MDGKKIGRQMNNQKTHKGIYEYQNYMFLYEQPGW